MKESARDAAFRATTYRVMMPERSFDVRIGVANPDLDDELRRRGISSWGIVTACNPGAERLSDEENRLRQARLRARVGELGRPACPACNIADDAAWPEEAGVFLAGSRAQICALAAEFGQLAAVYGELATSPVLLWVGVDGLPAER